LLRPARPFYEKSKQGELGEEQHHQRHQAHRHRILHVHGALHFHQQPLAARQWGPRRPTASQFSPGQLFDGLISLVIISGPPAVPVADSYVRFPTSEQKKGDSLRRQTALSENYAEKHGLTLDNTLHLHDLGVSPFGRSHRSAGGGRCHPCDVFAGDYKQLVRSGDLEEWAFIPKYL
jgi:hypothetical protein